jgi:hypothetical protein
MLKIHEHLAPAFRLWLSGPFLQQTREGCTRLLIVHPGQEGRHLGGPIRQCERSSFAFAIPGVAGRSADSRQERREGQQEEGANPLPASKPSPTVI